MAKFSGRGFDGDSGVMAQSDAARELSVSSSSAASPATLSLGSAGVAPLTASTAPASPTVLDTGGAIPTSLAISQAALAAAAPVSTPAAPVEALSLADASAIAFSAMKGGTLHALDTQLSALYYASSDQSALMANYTASVTQISGAVSADGSHVLIDASAKDGSGAVLLTQLQSIGLEGGSAYGSVASGWLPTASLQKLVALSDLNHARESGFTTNSGIVTTQADHAEHADTARATYGVDGTGFRVGVLSDSFNTAFAAGDASDNAADNVASGDLPTGIRVLQDSSGEDEGRAIAQLIHDLAPGAGIDYATANGGQANFANNIVRLAAAGDKVIVDDVGYFAETMYQDGIIAQAISQVVQQDGVSYFSSAGNSGQEGWQGAWVTGTDETSIDGTPYKVMQFAPGQDYLPVTLSGTDTFVLEWDDPAASAGGVGVQNADLDLYLTNASGSTVYAASASDNSGGDPVELFQLTGTGTAYLRVGAYGANVPTNIRLVALGNGAAVNLATTATNTNEGTTYGHNSSPDSISVGAVSYARTPVNDYTPPVAESFTARGTVTTYFDTEGNRLATPVTRSGVNISAVDGGNTTFFVSDDTVDTDTFPNFYGTSAAAPDAAAVAVLMLQANPTLTRDDILHILMDSALDEDDSATPTFDTGFDVRTGSGLIQADAALSAATGHVITSTLTTLYGTHLADLIAGGAGNDTIYGGDGGDTIDGGGGNDTIQGESGDDVLVGGAGADTIFGGVGNDTVEGGAGNDFLYGGSGVNTVLYIHAPSAVTVDLATESATGGDGTDLVRGFQNVFGSDFGDKINGDDNNNVLVGGAGADTIQAGGGDDVVDGGAGGDILSGGGGSDILTYARATAGITLDLSISGAQDTGGSGMDSVSGFETVIGSAFADHLTAAGVGEILMGGAGDDVLSGGASIRETVDQPDLTKTAATTNHTTADAFAIPSGSFDLVNDPDVGSAQQIPHATVNATSAGGGPDVYAITVAAGTHGIFDLDHFDNDSVLALTDATGTVIVFNDDAGGDPGSPQATDSLIDYTFATAGTYYLQVFAYGTTANIFGNLAAGQTYEFNISLSDEAVSYTGNLLPGGPATLQGGDGDDILISGTGNDTIDGGAGNDIVSYAGALTAVSINLSLTTAQATGGGGTDMLANVESVIGSGFADTLVGSALANFIAGGGGADSLTGGDGADTFYYGAVSDSTPAAADTITDFTHGSDKIDLTAVSGGVIALQHDVANHTIVQYAFSGNTPGGQISVTGDVEADDIVAAAGTNFVIVGLDATTPTDKLVGGAAADTILGGAGADLIIGGGGADTLAGGAGADIFRLLSPNDSTLQAYDLITDFQNTGTASTSDSIDLRYAANGFVGLLHSDDGTNTAVFFNPVSGTTAAGAIVALGDVELNNLNVFGGTVLYDVGGSGVDNLVGSAFADTLLGNAGADTLKGNAGADTLTGGADADTFLYALASDSTAAAQDTITDFQHGTDKLDLHLIDGGKITLTYNGGGNTTVTTAFPTTGAAVTLILVHGDVEAADLITSAGAVITPVGTFSAVPTDLASSDHIGGGLAQNSHNGEFSHVYLA